MNNKKLYIAPEVDVVFINAMNLLTASFSEQIEDSDPLTDPDEIL